MPDTQNNKSRRTREYVRHFGTGFSTPAFLSVPKFGIDFGIDDFVLSNGNKGLKDRDQLLKRSKN